MKIFKTDPEEQLRFQVKKHGTDRNRSITVGKQGDWDTKIQRRRKDIEFIKKHLPKSESILCVGCRDDSEVQDFLDAGYDAIGIDVANDSNLVKCLDAHKIAEEYNEDQFDVVYASHSLEHMYDAPAVLAAVRSVAKLGVFIILPRDHTPSIKHPCIFRMCRAPSNVPVEELLDDFSSLREFEVLEYFRRRVPKEKRHVRELEIILFLKWV